MGDIIEDMDIKIKQKIVKEFLETNKLSDPKVLENMNKLALNKKSSKKL